MIFKIGYHKHFPTIEKYKANLELHFKINIKIELLKINKKTEIRY
jgi:hypothetical protein